MKKLIQDIENFHKKFFPDVNEETAPFSASSELIKMRLDFMLEELVETAHALGFVYNPVDDAFTMVNDVKDLPEALDGMVDLLYVLMGSAYLFGLLSKRGLFTIDTIFEQAWDRVQQANMQKVRCEAPGKRGTAFDVKKPAGWKKPRLDDLVC
jgi:predicted HAD superfamily Cof-like phosphohydrolase